MDPHLLIFSIDLYCMKSLNNSPIQFRETTENDMAHLTRMALRRGDGTLTKVVEPLPVMGPTDLLIHVKAVALNWKDAAILNNKFPWPNSLPTGIHGSELSGEIVDLGNRVTTFKERR